MFMERPAGCSWNGWPDAVECAPFGFQLQVNRLGVYPRVSGGALGGNGLGHLVQGLSPRERGSLD